MKAKQDVTHHVTLQPGQALRSDCIRAPGGKSFEQRVQQFSVKIVGKPGQGYS